METTFAVVAHQFTPVFERLVHTLAATHRPVVLHIDASADLAQFPSFAEHVNVSYVPHRVAVNWGGFSQVEATLATLRHAQRPDMGHVVLMSGADYPLTHPSALVAHLEAQPDTDFLSLYPMPDPEHGKPITRLSRYHYYEFPRGSSRPDHLAWRVLNRVGLPRRYQPLLHGKQPFGGSNWWALSAASVAAVLAASVTDDDLTRLYRWSRCSDEGYFHTVLGNLPDRRATQPPLTFAEWTRPTGPQPAWCDDALIDAMVRERGGEGGRPELASAWIARKFRGDDLDLVDRVEREVWTLPNPR